MLILPDNRKTIALS